MNAPVQMTMLTVNFVRKSHYKKFMRDFKHDVKKTDLAFMIFKSVAMFEEKFNLVVYTKMDSINSVKLIVDGLGTVDIHVQDLNNADHTMIYLYGVVAHFLKSCVEHDDTLFFSQNKTFFVADDRETACRMFVDHMTRQVS